MTISYRFLVRGGTAANLAAVNEIPLARELIFETDSTVFKLGDGVTAYNALPNRNAGGGGGGGTGWLHDSGVPDVGVGVDGNYYLDIDTGDVYFKDTGAWTLLISLYSGPTRVISTSGSITLSAATHNGRMLLHDTGAITLPETVAAGFEVNDIVEVRRNTAGAVTFVAGGAAVLDYNNTIYSPAILFPKDVVGLKVVAVNTWAIFGPLASA